MVSIREILANIKHRSKVLTYLWYLSRKPKYYFDNKSIEKDAEKRRSGTEDKKYAGIKRYKNTHDGERCFIVATGPSLKMEDLEMLKNEYSFGMNSICKIFENTSWRPTYYGIQDENVYETMDKDILKYYAKSENVFVSDVIAKRNAVPDTFNVFPLNRAYHDNELHLDKYFAKFSDDCYSIVYDGYSITYSLIQIAVYMGFKEIYLLGADCSYKKGEKNHIAESGFIDKNEEKNHEKMITGYKVAKEYAEGHGITIVNVTRGGMLEVYKRENLEDVLKRK